MEPVKNSKSRASNPQPANPRLVLLKRGMKATSCPIGRIPVTIGRGAGNTVPLEDERASRNHAVVELRERGVVVRDRGSTNGTFVNERKVKSRPLLPGDVVRVGWSAFIYLVDGMPQRAEPRKPVGWIVGRLSDGREVKWPVGGPPVLMGGAPETEILLAEDGVCDYHALVAVRSGEVIMIELAPEPPRVTTLYDGADLRFGATVMKYRAEVLRVFPESAPSQPSPFPARPPEPAVPRRQPEPPPPEPSSEPAVTIEPADVVPSEWSGEAAPPAPRDEPAKPEQSRQPPVSPDQAPPQPPPRAKPRTKGNSPSGWKPPAAKPRTGDSIALNLNVQCSDASLMGTLRAEAERVEQIDAFPQVPQELAPTRPVTEDIQPAVISDLRARVTMITVVRGRLAGKTVSLGSGAFLIGSDAACNLQLDDAGVSGRHACIKNEEGSVIIEDLDSLGGVSINGQSIRRERLHPGDIISIGPNEILAHL